MAWIFLVTLVGCPTLLVLSIYPGVLADITFLALLSSPIWMTALFVGGFLSLFYREGLRTGKVKEAPDKSLSDDAIIEAGPAPAAFRRGLASVTAVALTILLLRAQVPRRVAFHSSRPAFDRLAASAPVVRSRFPVGEFARRVGVYQVDRRAADARGGVYFRTHTGPDGIGPDTMSYGFAYRPNFEGTPFGKSGYRLTRVSGDWYVFEASDDN